MVGERGELPGAGGTLPEGGCGARREHERGGRGVVAEGAAGDGSAGVDLELKAGAGLGVVAVEDAEIHDVGRPISEAPTSWRTATAASGGSQGGGAGRAFGDGDAVGAGAEDGHVELTERDGFAGAVELVELDGPGNQPSRRPRWMSWPAARRRTDR